MSFPNGALSRSAPTVTRGRVGVFVNPRPGLPRRLLASISPPDWISQTLGSKNDELLLLPRNGDCDKVTAVPHQLPVLESQGGSIPTLPPPGSSPPHSQHPTADSCRHYCLNGFRLRSPVVRPGIRCCLFGKRGKWTHRRPALTYAWLFSSKQSTAETDGTLSQREPRLLSPTFKKYRFRTRRIDATRSSETRFRRALHGARARSVPCQEAAPLARRRPAHHAPA